MAKLPRRFSEMEDSANSGPRRAHNPLFDAAGAAEPQLLIDGRPINRLSCKDLVLTDRALVDAKQLASLIEQHHASCVLTAQTDDGSMLVYTPGAWPGFELTQ